jgi:hypothetical protein
MLCPACGTENDLGRKFCGECGGSLALICAACESPNSPGVKFCGECGAALSGQTAASPWLDRARAVAALEAVAG